MNKVSQRKLRHRRIRAKVVGTAKRPRLNVFRSLNHIYAQLIDDEQGKTLAQASSHELKTQGNKSKIAEEVGNLVATKALKLGISHAVFDRAGYKYHGRIKSLAEAVRAAGVKL